MNKNVFVFFSIPTRAQLLCREHTFSCNYSHRRISMMLLAVLHERESFFINCLSCKAFLLQWHLEAITIGFFFSWRVQA